MPENKKLLGGIGEYLKYGIVNYVVQITIAMVAIVFVL